MIYVIPKLHICPRLKFSVGPSINISTIYSFVIVLNRLNVLSKLELGMINLVAGNFLNKHKCRMSMCRKKRWIILIVTLLIFNKGFSQDCSVNFFVKGYTGDGFSMGGTQDDRLTILPDSSMIVCSARFIARVSQKGNVLWSKYFKNYGGNASNALVDYDGTILCVMGSSVLVKLDTSGNFIYEKKMHFNMESGYDITYSEGLTDIAILDNGDKIILYQSLYTEPFGGYLFRVDKDMTTIKWCKSIRYNGINFTNIVIEGNKIVVAGASKPNSNPAAFVFLSSFDINSGGLIKTNFFNCDNLSVVNRLYKGNGQYFLKGVLLNQTDAAGRYFYMRIDANFNLLAIRRIVGYTDNFLSVFSLAPQIDNSLYGMSGRGGFTTTMFKIDKEDSVIWVKAHLNGGFPGDIKQNSEALYFLSDWEYNAVGVGAKSTFYLFKSDFNGNVGPCKTELPATLETNRYNFYTVPPVTFEISDKICSINAESVNSGNYPLDEGGCSYTPICNSIKLRGDTAICNNQPAYFTATRNASCNSPITWSVYPEAPYTVVNDSIISVNFVNNGNYKITSKISDRCNTYSDSITVHANISGALHLPDDSILCEGNTIKISAGNQFKNYKWQDGSSDSFVIAKQAGKYFVTVNDYCGKIYSDTMNIMAANFYFNIGNDTVKCNGDSLILKATSGFYNYQWSSQYNLHNLDDSTVIVNPLVDTVYVATAEKMQGCFVKDSIKITVSHSPAIFLGSDTSLCAGQSLVLDAGNNFAMYQWSTGDVSQKIRANSAGTYFIKATAANGCSSKDTLKILNVNPLPAFTLGRDTTLCQGEKLSYNFNLPAATYLWNNGSNLGSSVIVNEGIYWLKITQESCSAADTINVSYKPSPVVYLGRDTVLCNGITKQLDATNNNATYIWQDGSTSASYIVEKEGLYFVTADINGCKAGDSVYIQFKSKPIISLVKDTSICKGQEITLKPITTTKDNYLWQDGSKNISLAVNAPGIYRLTTSNECGITTNEVNINWGTCELYMPSAFTPNNDGINDLFRVKNYFAVKEFSFIIYNRFGQKVFESQNIKNGWNGLYKGMPQNNGIYVWTISFIDSDNIRKFAKGSVLLIR